VQNDAKEFVQVLDFEKEG
jgi:hypothetical protein